MKREQRSPRKVATARRKARRAVQPAGHPKAPSRPRPAKIPAILLEGDASPAPAASGPGQRYALGPAAPPKLVGEHEESGELPEAYGTKRLSLTVRDPHWVCAHWDLTREQLRGFNAASVDGHLVVRLYGESMADQPCAVAPVHPESLHWFIPVPRGGEEYAAELGYFDPAGQWVTISRSSPVRTPPDRVSNDATARFETIPVSVPLEELLEVVRAAVSTDVPLAEALLQLRALGYEGLPQPAPGSLSGWTPDQERALAQIVGAEADRSAWSGSVAIPGPLRRQLDHRVSPEAVPALMPPAGLWGGSGAGISSPAYAAERRAPGFWFNLNAELIIYGATEPDAKVSIAGRRIRLRPDGTFSCRFAFPDGKYELPVIAVAAAGTDARLAELEFSRRTDYTGEVGVVVQDPTLKEPSARGVV